MKRSRVAIIVGTRPEAIKLAPLIRALSRSQVMVPLTVFTAQHRELAEPILRSFGIKVSCNLEVMKRAQSLWGLAARLAEKLGRFFETHPVDAVLVQGDTSSALFGGLCAFYHRIPVGHVEAGLRTGERYSPFPEEMNRKLLGSLATWHFAPTREAVRRLRQEGVPARSIHLTGNTVVDAVDWMSPRCDDRLVRCLLGSEAARRRLILVTCHRRENLGAPMRAIARGLRTIGRNHPELLVLFPLHPNPAVRKLIRPTLASLPNVVLCEPLDYLTFLACLKQSHLVITDSGGVQEEATVLGKPVLVFRGNTERPEGLKAGNIQLVGTTADRLAGDVERLLLDPQAYRRMSRPSPVFGDGHASERIVQILERCLVPRE
jgi:UDP-N-acetylglucosamine 2-epimerase (non-hydrolysing)